MRSVGLRPTPANRVPVVQRPRTPPFHGDDTGSNPVGDANILNHLKSRDSHGTNFCDLLSSFT